MDTSAPEKLSVMRIVQIKETKMHVFPQFISENFAYIAGYAY